MKNQDHQRTVIPTTVAVMMIQARTVTVTRIPAAMEDLRVILITDLWTDMVLRQASWPQSKIRRTQYSAR
jgi:hypothetical protein